MNPIATTISQNKADSFTNYPIVSGIKLLMAFTILFLLQSCTGSIQDDVKVVRKRLKSDPNTEAGLKRRGIIRNTNAYRNGNGTFKNGTFCARLDFERGIGKGALSGFVNVKIENNQLIHVVWDANDVLNGTEHLKVPISSDGIAKWKAGYGQSFNIELYGLPCVEPTVITSASRILVSECIDCKQQRYCLDSLCEPCSKIRKNSCQLCGDSEAKQCDFEVSPLCKKCLNKMNRTCKGCGKISDDAFYGNVRQCEECTRGD
jgi:hypothetical protein